MLGDKQKIDAAYTLYRKYNNLPRAGWIVKGSRAKANQTILVPRTEAVEMASNLHDSLYAQAVYVHEIANLRHYLETLANGEPDAVKCEKCYAVYRSGWLQGKCPYCEATAAALSMVNKPHGSNGE